MVAFCLVSPLGDEAPPRRPPLDVVFLYMYANPVSSVHTILLCIHVNTLGWFCSLCLKSLVGGGGFSFSRSLPWPSGRGALGGHAGGRVDILRRCLRRHLDDPRLVDDAGRAVAFLHDADDPRLVAFAIFWGLDLSAEAGGLLPRETDEQASCRQNSFGHWGHLAAALR